MNIADFIPTGHEKAVSREYLVDITGANDREIRMAIAESDELILNVGKGYFIFDPETDMNELKVYALRERSRYNSQRKKLEDLLTKGEKAIHGTT